MRTAVGRGRTASFWASFPARCSSSVAPGSRLSSYHSKQERRDCGYSSRHGRQRARDGEMKSGRCRRRRVRRRQHGTSGSPQSACSRTCIKRASATTIRSWSAPIRGSVSVHRDWSRLVDGSACAIQEDIIEFELVDDLPRCRAPPARHRGSLRPSDSLVAALKAHEAMPVVTDATDGSATVDTEDCSADADIHAHSAADSGQQFRCPFSGTAAGSPPPTMQGRARPSSLICRRGVPKRNCIESRFRPGSSPARGTPTSRCWARSASEAMAALTSRRQQAGRRDARGARRAASRTEGAQARAARQVVHSDLDGPRMVMCGAGSAIRMSHRAAHRQEMLAVTTDEAATAPRRECVALDGATKAARFVAESGRGV